MNNLLQWAIINTATESEDASKAGASKTPPQKLDPAIIDLILGKDDSTQMKEFVAVACSDLATLEQKELALEDMETLVGQIDNAKNLQNLGLWGPLLDLLASPDASVRKNAAWVCGTAVQNNPEAKTAFTEKGGLQNMLTVLRGDADVDVRAKALYCLSSLLQNAPPLLEMFISQGGLEALREIITHAGPETANLQRRTIFTIQALAAQHPPFSYSLMRSSLSPALLSVARKGIELEDEDLTENALQAYFTVVGRSTLRGPEKKELREILAAIETAFPEIRWSEGEKAAIKRLA